MLIVFKKLIQLCFWDPAEEMTQKYLKKFGPKVPSTELTVRSHKKTEVSENLMVADLITRVVNLYSGKQ